MARSRPSGTSTSFTTTPLWWWPCCSAGGKRARRAHGSGQNPQTPPASPTRESAAEPQSSDAESTQETIAALGRENSTLRSEVLRLLRVESDLSRHNASLERQSSAYKQLAELGKRFNHGISRLELAAALVQFALYTANLQRCVVQLAQGDRFHTLAQDGYYDPDQERAVNELSLAEDDPLITELKSADQPRLRALPTASAPASPDATAERFLSMSTSFCRYAMKSAADSLAIWWREVRARRQRTTAASCPVSRSCSRSPVWWSWRR